MKISIKDALEKGVSAHKNGRLEEASYYYDEILKSQPSHPDANHNLGGIVAMFGDPARAIPYLKIAVEANPRQAQYWYSYINTLIKAGETQQAKAALELGMRTVLEPGDQSRSLQRQLNPQTHLGFFYDYLRQMGVFKSDNENITDGDGQPRPKLTDSFLHWFETQDWSSLKLLELGAEILHYTFQIF